jgi:hypothetical protein
MTAPVDCATLPDVAVVVVVAPESAPLASPLSAETESDVAAVPESRTAAFKTRLSAAGSGAVAVAAPDVDVDVDTPVVPAAGEVTAVDIGVGTEPAVVNDAGFVGEVAADTGMAAPAGPDPSAAPTPSVAGSPSRVLNAPANVDEPVWPAAVPDTAADAAPDAAPDALPVPEMPAAAGANGELPAWFAPDADAVTVSPVASASSAAGPEAAFTAKTAGFATAAGFPACGAGAGAGGGGLPVTGKPPPGCSLSAVLEDTGLRAGFGLASCNAPANVDPLPVALA